VIGTRLRGGRTSRLRLALYAFVSTVVIAGLLAGAATGVFSSLGRSALYATGVYRDGGAATLPPGFFDTPVPTSTTTPRGPEEPVLPVRAAGPNPKGPALAAKVASIADAGTGTPGYAVGDPSKNKVITSVRGGTAMIPASSMKLLTSLAALDAYGPEHRFTTSVVSAGAGSLVLVGGGDPYLATKRSTTGYPRRASLDDLADQVVKALRSSGSSASQDVSLDWDGSLFSGPAWNPTWPARYSDQTTPTSALWVEEGRTGGGSPGPREPDPARAAAAAFADVLEDRGLSVDLGQPSKTGQPTRTGKTGKGPTLLARTRSMPLAQIVEQLLLHSDNDAAEVLFRQVPIADGRAGSVASARTAVERRLTDLGVWTDNSVVQDGSGLSPGNRVVPRTFLLLLGLGLSAKHPEFRSLATGLPVAGSDGSLRYRFFADGTKPARGSVHAKTGTLTGVHALVGYVTTADGALVSFAFVLNSATSDYNARTWLDRAAATVAGCGC